MPPSASPGTSQHDASRGPTRLDPCTDAYTPSLVPGHTDPQLDMLPAPAQFRAVATSLQVDEIRRGGICWTDVAVGFILGVTLGIVAVTAFVELVSGGGR